MSPLRILFLTSAWYCVSGYWRTFHLARQLVKRGHEVTVVCQRNDLFSKCNHKTIDGVEVYMLPSLSASVESLRQTRARARDILRSMLTFSTQTGLNILRSVTSDIDVLHTYDALLPQNALPTILSKLKRTSQKPAVFVDWDDWWGRGGMLDELSRGIYRKMTSFLTFMEEKIPLHADGVTVINQTFRRLAIGVGVSEKKLFMVPNGADVDEIKPLDMYDARKRLRLPPKAVIYTITPRSYETHGKISMAMNKVLLAHKTVVAAYPDTFLLLLGGDSEAWMTDAKSLGIDKHVISVGFQPVDKYSLFLSAPNFFLFPLENTITNRVRSPLRVAEYMAAGRPIITTGLPEIKNELYGCGLFIRSFKPSDLTEGILHAIRNPDLCKKMGELARERVVKHYSWSSLAQQLERVYYQMLCARGTR